MTKAVVLGMYIHNSQLPHQVVEGDAELGGESHQ